MFGELRAAITMSSKLKGPGPTIISTAREVHEKIGCRDAWMRPIKPDSFSKGHTLHTSQPLNTWKSTVSTSTGILVVLYWGPDCGHSPPLVGHHL